MSQAVRSSSSRGYGGKHGLRRGYNHVRTMEQPWRGRIPSHVAASAASPANEGGSTSLGGEGRGGGGGVEIGGRNQYIVSSIHDSKNSQIWETHAVPATTAACRPPPLSPLRICSKAYRRQPPQPRQLLSSDTTAVAADLERPFTMPVFS